MPYDETKPVFSMVIISCAYYNSRVLFGLFKTPPKSIPCVLFAISIAGIALTDRESNRPLLRRIALLQNFPGAPAVQAIPKITRSSRQEVTGR